MCVHVDGSYKLLMLISMFTHIQLMWMHIWCTHSCGIPACVKCTCLNDLNIYVISIMNDNVHLCSLTNYPYNLNSYVAILNIILGTFMA